MNQLYYGDNLDVLRLHVADESVDLVYLDPPFNSNANYNVLFAERDGTQAAAQIKAFEDTWRWDEGAARAYADVVEAGGRVSQAMQAFRTFLGESDMLAYLAMMAPRLVELRRVLKPAAQAAKGFLVPLLLFFFASGGAAYQLWSAIFIIPVTVSAMLRYVVFRYRLGDDELVVRDGILTRTERHIPYARIQNIDLVQNPFHRLLDVALVRVETASGTKPEAVIRVLSLSAIDEMRAHVFAGRGEGEIAQAAPDELRTESRVLVKLPAGELAKLGIVSNQGLVVVAAALGLVWQTTGWEPDENPLEEYVGAAPAWLTDLTDGSVLTMAAAIAFFVIVAVVLLRMLSVGWFLVQLYGFTLRRRDDDLRAEYGLFTRVSRTIPTSRIQTLTTTESALHRLFGRQSVELRTVGGGGGDLDIGLEGATPKARNQWLAPMVETARVSELLTQVLPEVDLGSVQWAVMSRCPAHSVIESARRSTRVMTTGGPAGAAAPVRPPEQTVMRAADHRAV